jgi:hypothetical protein
MAVQEASPVSVATLSKTQRRKLQTLSRPHELTATLGVLNMMATVAIANRFPAHYWIWHLIRTFFYLPTRYIQYRSKNCHLYLMDWCYVVTYLSNLCGILAFVRVMFGISTPLVTYNADLIRSGFAMACGPLAWSIFVFRNSIVFHEVDRATSVFIHLSPNVLFWCLRWGVGNPSVIYDANPGMFHVCETEEDFAAADNCLRSWNGWLWCSACSAPPSAFVVVPLILYLGVWAVPYFLLIFVLWRDWIEQNQQETLYSYFCQTQPELHSWLGWKLSGLFGIGQRWSGPLGYMLLHMVSMMVLCATSYFLWHSFLLHNLMLLMILFKAVDNGSTYMFRVFAYRYAQEHLEQHRKDVLE